MRKEMTQNSEAISQPISIIDVDKIGSATSPLHLARTVAVVPSGGSPTAGDVIAVRALTDSATYNMLELPSGRLAKINPGDRKSTRLNSSHLVTSYAVFCLKKEKA